MARQTKVGMLVAFGVILLLGIIVSDHLSSVRRQEPASLTGMAPLTAAQVSNQDGTTRKQPLLLPGETAPASQQNPAQGASNISPDAAPVKPDIIASRPGATDPSSTFIIQKVNAPASSNDVIGSGPAITFGSDAPSSASSEKIHTVAKGDSLFSISKQYYGDGNKWQKIADANKLTKNSQLKLGMKLSIPMETATAKPAAPAKEAPSTQPAANSTTTPVASTTEKDASAEKFGTYTVKQGDVLSTIASKTMGSKNKWKLIMDANKDTLKKPEDLKPGMTLKIPRSSNAV